MSYSFSVSGTSKQECKVQLRRKVAEVVHQQPPHAQEMHAVQAAAEAMIDACDLQPGQSVSAVLYGSVSCADWQNPSSGLSQAQCNIQVNVG